MPRDTDDDGWLLLEDEMGRHHGWEAEYTETWLSDYQYIHNLLNLDINQTLRQRRAARRLADFEVADEF